MAMLFVDFQTQECYGYQNWAMFLFCEFVFRKIDTVSCAHMWHSGIVPTHNSLAVSEKRYQYLILKCIYFVSIDIGFFYNGFL